MYIELNLVLLFNAKYLQLFLMYIAAAQAVCVFLSAKKGRQLQISILVILVIIPFQELPHSLYIHIYNFIFFKILAGQHYNFFLLNPFFRLNPPQDNDLQMIFKTSLI